MPVLDPNPLTEATSASLDELFARDPLELSRQDRDKIIAELRAKRHLWAQAEAQGKTRAPAKAPKPTVGTPEGMEDLGL